MRHKNGTLAIEDGRRLRLALKGIAATNIVDPYNLFKWVPFTFEGGKTEHLILATSDDLTYWQPPTDDPDNYPINKINLIFEQDVSNLKRNHVLNFASDNDSDIEEKRIEDRIQKSTQQHKKQKKEENISTPEPTKTPDTDSITPNQPTATKDATTVVIPQPDVNQIAPTKVNDSDRSTNRGRGKRNHNRSRRAKYDEEDDATRTNNSDNNSNSSSRTSNFSNRRGRGGYRQKRSPSRDNSSTYHDPQRHDQQRRRQNSDRSYRERSPLYRQRNRDHDYYSSRSNHRRDDSRDRYDRNDYGRYEDSRDSRNYRNGRGKSPANEKTSTLSSPKKGNAMANTITSTLPTGPTVEQNQGLATNFANGHLPSNPLNNGTSNWLNLQYPQQFQQHQQPQLHHQQFSQWNGNNQMPPNGPQFQNPLGVWNGNLSTTMPPPQWNGIAATYNTLPPPPSINQPPYLQPGGFGPNTQLYQQQQQNYGGSSQIHGPTAATPGDNDIQILRHTGIKRILRNSLFRYGRGHHS